MRERIWRFATANREIESTHVNGIDGTVFEENGELLASL
jgi:hypothetical protein